MNLQLVFLRIPATNTLFSWILINSFFNCLIWNYSFKFWDWWFKIGSPSWRNFFEIKGVDNLQFTEGPDTNGLIIEQESGLFRNVIFVLFYFALKSSSASFKLNLKNKRDPTATGSGASSLSTMSSPCGQVYWLLPFALTMYERLYDPSSGTDATCNLEKTKEMVQNELHYTCKSATLLP